MIKINLSKIEFTNKLTNWRMMKKKEGQIVEHWWSSTQYKNLREQEKDEKDEKDEIVKE